MKVTTAEPIIIARAKREPKINPFDAHVVTWNDGATRRIELEDGDVLSTVLGNLRKAAAKIDRTVVKSLDPVAEGAEVKSFRFFLKPKVAKKGSAAVESVTIEVPAVASAKPKTSVKK